MDQCENNSTLSGPVQVFIGIDPGLNGAIGYFTHDGSKMVADVVRTPTIWVSSGRTKKREYDAGAAADILRKIASLPGTKMCMLERAHAMPGQGVTSMFTTGYGYGIWIGLLAAVGVPCQVVSAQRWKKALGLNFDKNKSRLMAMRLYPELRDRFSRKTDDGCAEAMLLVEYGRMLYAHQKII